MEMSFDYGRVRVSIVDELGKIQVNSLVKFPDGRDFNESQRQMWEHFLNLAHSCPLTEPMTQPPPP